MDAQAIARSLKGKKTGTGYVCRCPAHEDRHASLSLTEKDGKILWHCHAGCSQDDVREALGRLGLLDLPPNRAGVPRRPVSSPAPPKHRTGSNGSDNGSTHAGVPRSRVITSYDYETADGKVIFQTVRLDPKDFRQRQPKPDGGWAWNLKGIEPVPYHLPELEQASKVFVTEGEKDADNLREHDLTATCNPMGAGKWRPDFGRYLTGKDVFILPDNDQPGRDHAQTVAASAAYYGAASVHVVELPDLPEKGDVSDWIAAGHNVEELEQLCASAPEWQPPAAPEPEPAAKADKAAKPDKPPPEPPEIEPVDYRMYTTLMALPRAKLAWEQGYHDKQTGAVDHQTCLKWLALEAVQAGWSAGQAQNLLEDYTQRTGAKFRPTDVRRIINQARHHVRHDVNETNSGAEAEEALNAAGREASLAALCNRLNILITGAVITGEEEAFEYWLEMEDGRISLATPESLLNQARTIARIFAKTGVLPVETSKPVWHDTVRLITKLAKREEAGDANPVHEAENLIAEYLEKQKVPDWGSEQALPEFTRNRPLRRDGKLMISPREFLRWAQSVGGMVKWTPDKLRSTLNAAGWKGCKESIRDGEKVVSRSYWTKP